MTSLSTHICYLMLAHERPDLCARVAGHILDAGGSLVIHLDRKTPQGFKDEMRATMGSDFERIYWSRREPVHWGEWSIVQATLNGLQEIEDRGIEPDYVYLISGSDYPIRPLSQLADFLQHRPGMEYIDLHDAEATRWVKGGPQVERYRYHHWVNWRTHPKLFSVLLNLQQRLKLERQMPHGLHPYIGSQWWVLTWATCRAVLERSRDRDLVKYFRTTWIPDELFFQTMVGNLVEDVNRLDRRHLTHYIFSETGRPVVFCDGHADYLARQPFFFARKISAYADRLRDQLDDVIAAGLQPPPGDAEIGRDTGEYHLFMERQRKATEERWTWGRPGRPPLGVLAYNRRRYLVICAESVELLEEAQMYLRNQERLLCHGQIFGAEQVDFAPGLDKIAGYERKDIAIRDQDRPAFLYDLLHSQADMLVAYLSLEPVFETTDSKEKEAFEEQVPIHWFDPRAIVVRLWHPVLGSPRAPESPECRIIEVDIEEADALDRLPDIVDTTLAELEPAVVVEGRKSSDQNSLHECSD